MRYNVKSTLQMVSIVFVLLLLSTAISYAKEYTAPIAELPNTNKKDPGSSVYVYESQFPGYYKYINGRYGFSIDFPQSFTLAFLPANNDGARFRLPDSTVELSVWGGHNSLKYTLDDYYNLVLQEIKGEKGYFAKGDDWFVVTWKQDGKIYYEKYFVSNDFQNGFTLSYPEEQKGVYDEVVSNIERSFIPGWKTGPKIWH